MNNTLKGINKRLEEAEDQISNLDNMIRKNVQLVQQKRKNLKIEDSLRDLWDNMKHNNIHIIGIPEEEERARVQ